MKEIDKYGELKMYLPLLGYSDMAELAREWGVTVEAIRRTARNQLTSARLSSLIDKAIKSGEKRFQDHRNKKTSAKA